MALLAACGRTAPVPRGIAVQAPLPRGVMSAHRACSLVLGAERRYLVAVKRVHVVLTTYAKGEPVESQGDYSTGEPPRTLVWVVEVHARAVNVPHSTPAGGRQAAATDYSVVMNAKTGRGTDFGIGNSWPLPLWKAGTMISLPAHC
jgi:hypothetical protein